MVQISLIIKERKEQINNLSVGSTNILNLEWKVSKLLLPYFFWPIKPLWLLFFFIKISWSKNNIVITSEAVVKSILNKQNTEGVYIFSLVNKDVVFKVYYSVLYSFFFYPLFHFSLNIIFFFFPRQPPPPPRNIKKKYVIKHPTFWSLMVVEAGRTGYRRHHYVVRFVVLQPVLKSTSAGFRRLKVKIVC